MASEFHQGLCGLVVLAAMVGSGRSRRFHPAIIEVDVPGDICGVGMVGWADKEEEECRTNSSGLGESEGPLWEGVGEE